MPLVVIVAMLALCAPAGARTIIAHHCSPWKYRSHGYERMRTCARFARGRHGRIFGHVWSSLFYLDSSPEPGWHYEKSKRVWMCTDESSRGWTSTLPCVEHRGEVQYNWGAFRCYRRGMRVHLHASGWSGPDNTGWRTTSVDLVYRCPS